MLNIIMDLRKSIASFGLNFLGITSKIGQESILQMKTAIIRDYKH